MISAFLRFSWTFAQRFLIFLRFFLELFGWLWSFPVPSCSKHWVKNNYLNQRGLMVSMIAFVSPRCHHHQCPNERVPLTPHPLHGNLKMLPCFAKNKNWPLDPDLKKSWRLFLFTFLSSVLDMFTVCCVLWQLFCLNPASMEAQWTTSAPNGASREVVAWQMKLVEMCSGILARCCLCSFRDWKDPTTVTHWQDLTSTYYFRVCFRT